MTLVELIMALAIMSVICTAVLALLTASAHTNAAITATITSQQELEMALRRMIQQTRMCSSLTVPSGNSNGTSFSLTTQPDTANSNASYSVSYSMVAVGGLNQLQETDTRYGTSVLIHDVQSFDVKLKNAGSPAVLIVTVTVGRNPSSTRTIRITPRNL
jgi:type II secretory pathway pseudopilin PulG